MKRDLSEAQFQAKARGAGWTPAGFMGYWNIGHGVNVCRHNAGPRRRDQLRYLFNEALAHDLGEELGVDPIHARMEAERAAKAAQP